MPAKTVLVVDDEPDHRTIATTILTHHAYLVVEAGDGRTALRKAREHRPQLVLMDAALPELDGWEATRRLKEDPTTSSIPIIMLSAHVLEEDRVRSTRVGCDGFISKPCSPHEILSEVRRWIG